MTSFTLTARAKSDLVAIARFTQDRWGLVQRNIYLKQFDEAFHMLADSPTIGKNCDYIKDGYHKFPQGSHIIFYKFDPEQPLRIIRILHKKMDVNSKLGGSVMVGILLSKNPPCRSGRAVFPHPAPRLYSLSQCKTPL